MKELPQRKPNRLQGYDYSQNGAYFVTICTKDRSELFCAITPTAITPIVGAVGNRPLDRPPYPKLTTIGEIIENEILIMKKIRNNVSVDQYIIMPNHIHMIIVIHNNGDGNGWLNGGENGRLPTAPTLQTIIRLWKRAISKRIGFSPWQKSFHERIIRDDEEYTRIAEYIQNNPARWQEDRFYQEGTNT